MRGAMVYNKINVTNQSTRSIEKIFEDAEVSGYLNLSGRKLKEFPKVRKEYNLEETVNADFSKNRFTEVPHEIIGYYCLERLDLYHNILRNLPETIYCLQSLIYLDLSRNQLQWLPPGICQLSNLQIILLGNNRISRLPSEIGNLSSLAELDISANQLSMLPASIGKLSKLRSLILRRNNLTCLPVEMSVLRLERLDLCANQLSALPIEMRVMNSLVHLDVSDNPLVSPPSNLCARGMIHMFKYLDNIANRGKGMRASSTDTLDGRGIGGKRRSTLPGRVNCRTPDPEMFYNGSHTHYSSNSSGIGLSNGNASGQSTPSTISPSASDATITMEDTIKQLKKIDGVKRPDKLTGLVPNKSSVANGKHSLSPDKKGPVEHIQTYREYKEAIRQRMQPQEIYKKTSPPELTPNTPTEKPPATYQNNVPEKRVTISPDKKRDPKMEAVVSYVKSQMANGHSSPTKNEAKLVTTSYVNNNKPAKSSPSRSLSFTMRREQEKAKEEALLISQLKHSLETRLKLHLPANELATALQDGVVLCHLANHVRPRSVASVHVPSPGVPKLTLAKSRRNVDNFLEACRKLGVPETLVCSAADVLEAKGLVRVAITTCELLKFHTPKQTQNTSVV